MIKLLKKLTKKDMALAGLAFLLILAQVYLNLTMPDYMSDMTVLVQTEGSAMGRYTCSGRQDAALCGGLTFDGSLYCCLARQRFQQIFLPTCEDRYLTECSHFQWKRSDVFQHPV